MAMDLRSLEHFVAITECGGFAEASRKLHISQPTLSRSIAQLEAKLGARLFSRGARGTVVTPDGERLLPHATSILAEVRRTQALFEDSGPALEAIIIETSPNFLHIGLPEALKTLFTAQPDCTAIVHTATMEAALENVRARRSDIALCLVPKSSHHGREMKELRFEELGAEILLPVVRPDHPARAVPLGLETLSRHEWAIPFQLSVSYRFETVFFRRNLPVPPQRLNCTSITLLRMAVLESGLIGLMPRGLIAQELATGQLHALPADELHFEYVVLMVTARLSHSDRRSARINTVADIIRTAVSGSMNANLPALYSSSE